MTTTLKYTLVETDHEKQIRFDWNAGNMAVMHAITNDREVLSKIGKGIYDQIIKDSKRAMLRKCEQELDRCFLELKIPIE